MKKIKKYFVEFSLLAIIFILIFIGSISCKYFLSWDNFKVILTLASILGIVTIGQTFVILTGGIDLSVGAIMGLTSILCAVILSSNGNILFSILLCLMTASLLGFVNGVIILKGRVPPIVTTLGMMWVIQGIAMKITNGQIIGITNEAFVRMGLCSVFHVPSMVIIWVGFSLFFFFILTCLSYGRYVYAIGGEEKVAFFSGINIDKVKLLVYTLSGLMAGMAGLLYTVYTSSGIPSGGVGYEFQSITAAALGGIALTGGRGNLWGAMLGTIVLTIIYNLFTYLAFSPYITGIFQGAILVGAVFISLRMRRINE